MGGSYFANRVEIQSTAEELDGHAFHEQHEAEPGLGPSGPGLAHAVLRAVLPGNAGVDEGLELAYVQVPLGPFIGVIAAGQFASAFGACPQDYLLVGLPYAHLSGLRLKLHDLYVPRTVDAQNLRVKIDIFHRRNLLDSAYPKTLPTANPEGQKFSLNRLIEFFEIKFTYVISPESAYLNMLLPENTSSSCESVKIATPNTSPAEASSSYWKISTP